MLLNLKPCNAKPIYLSLLTGTYIMIYIKTLRYLCCNFQTPVKIPDRVNRLKDEEIHIVEKEKEHERYDRVPQILVI